MLPVTEPISDETPLYRRIHPVHLVPDENENCLRVSTGAFRDTAMSIAIGDTLDAIGRAPETVLEGYPDQYLVAFAAGDARAADPNLEIVRDPTPAEPAHGEVRGKKKKPVMRALARACVWVVAPENGCEPPYPALEAGVV